MCVCYVVIYIHARTNETGVGCNYRLIMTKILVGYNLRTGPTDWTSGPVRGIKYELDHTNCRYTIHMPHRQLRWTQLG